MNAKRIISLLLTFAMVVGMLATGAVSAFAAEDTVITRIEATINGVEVGRPLSGVTVTAPADANYEVTIDHFTDGNGAITDLSHVIGNRYYTVGINVIPKEGYTLPGDDTQIVINGTGLLKSSAYVRDTDAYRISNIFDFGTPIDKVDITVTGMEEGKSGADVKVTVPQGANYVVESFLVFDNEWKTVTGIFGKGKYTADIYLKPADGHRFTGDTVVTINGGEPGFLNTESNRLNTVYDADFSTPIDKVDITVTGVEEGKSTADVKVTVPEGVNYALDYLYIVDSDWDEFSGTFGKGVYYVNIVMEPGDGWCFTEDTVVTINGGEPGYLYAKSDYLIAEYDADFRTPIDKVDITITGVEEGKSAADVKVTVSGDISYDLHYSIEDSLEEIFAGTFVKDGYTVELALKVPEGYYFAEDVQVTINGKSPDYLDSHGDELTADYEVEFRTLIDRVELPAWPTVAVGGKIPEPALVLPEGVHYAYMIQVAEYSPDEMTQAIGTYQNDKVYMIVMVAQADPCYAFAKNTTVTVGGETFTGIVMVDGNACGITKLVSLGSTKLVDKISVSTEQPTAGKAPGKITNAGTGYTLEDTVWGVSNTDSLSGYHKPGETFQVGEYVYMSLYIKLDSGYLIDPNAKVWVNGKAYDVIVEESWTGGNEGTFMICLGQLKAATTPPTGDSTPIAMLVVLTVASMLGMGLLIVRRKSV